MKVPSNFSHHASKECLLFDLGYVEEYEPVWNLQKKLVEGKIRGGSDSLVLVEHGHVITLGRSSHFENLLMRDLPTFNIERGGDVTYHGPGQLVAYPILSLEERGLGVRQYIELLEGAIVDSLSKFGLEAAGKLGKETGVWIEDRRKIASIGVAVSHWVTFHGLALNVSTDLSYFQRINPCGFSWEVMTSLEKELGQRVEKRQVQLALLESISSRLGWKVQNQEKDVLPSSS